MRNALLLAVVVASACNKPKPETTMYSGVGRDVTKHVLGARLYIGASWQARCTDWSAAFDDLLSKNGDDYDDDTEPCKEKPFELTISCSSKCTQLGPRTSSGAIGVTVIPDELGPLTITATQRRTDTGQTSTKTLPGVLVVEPDRLELQCETGGQQIPCGPDGVDASKPQLKAVIHVGDRTEESAALRVNGKGLPDPQSPFFSLADIYPEAREGDGIKPGTYAVQLAVGAKTSTWQVVAR